MSRFSNDSWRVQFSLKMREFNLAFINLGSANHSDVIYASVARFCWSRSLTDRQRSDFRGAKKDVNQRSTE